MRLLYITVDGRCVPEKCSADVDFIQMPDGLHPMTNDSVWQDARRVKDSLLIIIKGVRGPYGAVMENDDVSRALYALKVKENAFQKAKVSKMWTRKFAAFMDALGRYGFYIGVAALIIYVVLMSMFPEVF